MRQHADVTGKILLEFSIRLYGATTKQRYETVCANCEEREGVEQRTASLIDFRAHQNIIEPRDGKIRVEFRFCCYPKCHQTGDNAYL